MSLSTGRRINCQHVTPLPLLQDVIDRVQWLARTNPSGLNVWYRGRLNFLGVTNDEGDDNDDKSTYNKMDCEGGKRMKVVMTLSPAILLLQEPQE